MRPPQARWKYLAQAATSRNRSRRWCSMADCGNRAKVRRFYQKEK
ncbi:CGNR zinc finger domain-containing protein [Paenibacillus glycinis]|nr:CGNR zinc finger domain-containing protein [Paenibacillus glycinis]